MEKLQTSSALTTYVVSVDPFVENVSEVLREPTLEDYLGTVKGAHIARLQGNRHAEVACDQAAAVLFQHPFLRVTEYAEGRADI